MDESTKLFQTDVMNEEEAEALIREIKEVRQVDLMKADREIQILRSLVFYCQAWVSDQKCGCDEERNVMCNRCNLLRRIDGDLGSLSDGDAELVKDRYVVAASEISAEKRREFVDMVKNGVTVGEAKEQILPGLDIGVAAQIVIEEFEM